MSFDLLGRLVVAVWLLAGAFAVVAPATSRAIERWQQRRWSRRHLTDQQLHRIIDEQRRREGSL